MGIIGSLEAHPTLRVQERALEQTEHPLGLKLIKPVLGQGVLQSFYLP